MSERFFFDLVCGEEVIRDEEGVEAKDLDQALVEARSAIAEMADEIIKANPDQPCLLIVRDATGALVERVPIMG